MTFKFTGGYTVTLSGRYRRRRSEQDFIEHFEAQNKKFREEFEKAEAVRKEALEQAKKEAAALKNANVPEKMT